jgi:hypothetical protein
LTLIKTPGARISDGRRSYRRINRKRMSKRPPLRHCPVCGIAMQAAKSRDDLEHFDRFECLSCNTTINAPSPDARNPRTPDRS